MRLAKVPNRTSAAVRSGWVAAKRAHRLPPSEAPNSAGRSEPTASITARRSSMRSSSVGSLSFGTRSDRPVPRLSKTIRRENEASRRRKRASVGSSQANSTCDTQPGT